jgi:hypothetical protein
MANYQYCLNVRKPLKVVSVMEVNDSAAGNDVTEFPISSTPYYFDCPRDRRTVRIARGSLYGRYQKSAKAARR